jgi:hypothetical protein
MDRWPIFDALTAQTDSTTAPLTAASFDHMPADRRKQIEATERRLAEAGI